METRINKYLSEVGFCSRRAADILIEERRVTINGKVPEMGTKVKEGDDVRVDGKPIKPTGEEHVYIALNKPVGIVCTTNVRGEKNNIVDFVKHPKRIFPVGRLDKASEGLILLTSDGDIVNKILRARNHHEKEYIVSVHKPINDDFVKRMSSGIPILDTVTRPCMVEKIGRCSFRIIPAECVITATGRGVGASSSTSILGLGYGRRTTPASQPRPNEHPEVVYHCAPCVYTVHTMHTVHTTRTLCTLRVHCAHCAPPIHPNACNGHISATIYRFAINNHRYPIICADLQQTRILPCNMGAYRRLIQGAIFGGPANQK